MLMRKSIIISIGLFFLLFMLSGRTLAVVDIGGELEINSGLSYFNDDLSADFSGSGEIELYLPGSAKVEPRVVLQGQLQPGDFNLGAKYLYLRYRNEQGHLTAGRQPVSWSYGGMVNLLDYGLGIEDLAGETVTPGIDGFRYHHSLGQDRSLQLIASFPAFKVDDFDEAGYGVRLRLPGSGYDFSFNLAYQPLLLPGHYLENDSGLDDNLSQDNLLRAGIAANGDIKDVGLYGSLGYFQLQDRDYDDIMIQLGTDYSWMVGEYEHKQLILQAEYIRFLQQDLSADLMMGLMTGGEDYEDAEMGSGKNLGGNILASDLLVVDLALNPDIFSSVGLNVMTEFEENTVVLSPYYTNELGGGLEFRVDGSLTKIDGDYNSRISSGFTYYF